MQNDGNTKQFYFILRVKTGEKSSFRALSNRSAIKASLLPNDVW